MHVCHRQNLFSACSLATAYPAGIEITRRAMSDQAIKKAPIIWRGRVWMAWFLFAATLFLSVSHAFQRFWREVPQDFQASAEGALPCHPTKDKRTPSPCLESAKKCVRVSGKLAEASFVRPRCLFVCRPPLGSPLPWPQYGRSPFIFLPVFFFSLYRSLSMRGALCFLRHLVCRALVSFRKH